MPACILFYLIIFLPIDRLESCFTCGGSGFPFFYRYKIFKDTLRKIMADFFIDQLQHLLVIAATGLLIWDAQLSFTGAAPELVSDLYIVIGRPAD